MRLGLGLSLVLFINLLIALMNDAYVGAREKGDRLYKFNWFVLVDESAISTRFVPPFTFLCVPLWLGWCASGFKEDSRPKDLLNCTLEKGKHGHSQHRQETAR